MSKQPPGALLTRPSGSCACLTCSSLRLAYAHAADMARKMARARPVWDAAGSAALRDFALVLEALGTGGPANSAPTLNEWAGGLQGAPDPAYVEPPQEPNRAEAV